MKMFQDDDHESAVPIHGIQTNITRTEGRVGESQLSASPFNCVKWPSQFCSWLVKMLGSFILFCIPVNSDPFWVFYFHAYTCRVLSSNLEYSFRHRKTEPGHYGMPN